MMLQGQTIRIIAAMRALKNIQPQEGRAIVSLALIMSLRMIGLFMVLPLFALYASQLQDATDALIGIAMGIYGLSQAIFQIPFGALSDRLGRKPMIGLGLLIFSAGSFLSAEATSIHAMILGRALQGVGAIGGTTLALLADLTREQIRTFSMAIIGMVIGLSFSIAMLLGPVLTQWFSLSALFFLAGILGLVAIIILYTYTPTPLRLKQPTELTSVWRAFLKLLTHPALGALNAGIFILHAVFTASFIVIPINLFRVLQIEAHRQWLLYLPTLFIGFVMALLMIGLAERRGNIKPYLVSHIIVLALSLLWLWLAPFHRGYVAVGLCLFFGSFSFLEAVLPSAISRLAPVAQKGGAFGLYSCSQFLGIFVGGALGGWLFGRYTAAGVYLFCTTLTLLWLVAAWCVQLPRSTPVKH
jgi:MFS family permease